MTLQYTVFFDVLIIATMLVAFFTVGSKVIPKDVKLCCRTESLLKLVFAL